jgi:hypothetical protein
MSIEFTDEQVAELSRWSQELRETKSLQGMGKLRSIDNRYCCLGIYANITSIGQWSNLNEDKAVPNWIFEIDDDYSALTLPYKTRTILGLNQSLTIRNVHGDFEERTLIFAFSQLNDYGKWTFLQIADEIDFLVANRTLSPKAQKAMYWRVVEDV